MKTKWSLPLGCKVGLANADVLAHDNRMKDENYMIHVVEFNIILKNSAKLFICVCVCVCLSMCERERSDEIFCSLVYLQIPTMPAMPGLDLSKLALGNLIQLLFFPTWVAGKLSYLLSKIQVNSDLESETRNLRVITRYWNQALWSKVQLS